MKLDVPAWTVGVKANVEATGQVIASLDVDSKHVYAIAVAAFKALPEQDRGMALADMVSLSEKTVEAARDIVAEFSNPGVAKS